VPLSGPEEEKDKSAVHSGSPRKPGHCLWLNQRLACLSGNHVGVLYPELKDDGFNIIIEVGDLLNTGHRKELMIEK